MPPIISHPSFINQFWYFRTICTKSLQAVLSFQVSDLQFLSRPCCISLPVWFNCCSNFWWRVEIKQLRLVATFFVLGSNILCSILNTFKSLFLSPREIQLESSIHTRGKTSRKSISLPCASDSSNTTDSSVILVCLDWDFQLCVTINSYKLCVQALAIFFPKYSRHVLKFLHTGFFFFPIAVGNGSIYSGTVLPSNQFRFTFSLSDLLKFSARTSRGLFNLPIEWVLWSSPLCHIHVKLILA